MKNGQRGYALPCARHLLWVIAAIAAAGCGPDGSSSMAGSGSSPPTQSDTAPQTVSPPSISGTPDTTVVANNQYSFRPGASDTAGDSLTFSIENLPSWATFNTTSGLLSGTPSPSNVGDYQSITISVSNGKAIAQLPSFSIQVMPPPAAPPPPPPTNAPPTITGTPAASVQAGSHYAFQPSAADADSDNLTFSATGVPSWASLNPTTGLLSGTPSSNDVGTYANIVVSVSDGTTLVSLSAFTITVTALPPAPPPYKPPTITGTPATLVQAGQTYSFQPVATDAAGTALTFSIANGPAWGNFNPTTGHLSGTPTTANVGTYSNIIISVSDGKTSVSLPTFSIQVTPPPAPPPTISGTPATQVQAGAHYSFTPSVSDPSGKVLSFAIQNLPRWASFSIASGQLSGTPASSDVGSYANIVISVSDGTLNAALAPFTITVTAPPATTGSATLSWTPPDKNTDGSAVTTLSGFVISYGTSASALSQAVSISNPATTSYTIQNLSQGTWYFAVSATASDGTVSSLSSVVSKTIQ